MTIATKLKTRRGAKIKAKNRRRFQSESVATSEPVTVPEVEAVAAPAEATVVAAPAASSVEATVTATEESDKPAKRGRRPRKTTSDSDDS
jgi:hypothetical protein